MHYTGTHNGKKECPKLYQIQPGPPIVLVRPGAKNSEGGPMLTGFYLLGGGGGGEGSTPNSTSSPPKNFKIKITQSAQRCRYMLLVYWGAQE